VVRLGRLADAGGRGAAFLTDPSGWLACCLAAFVAVSAIPVGSLAMLLITYLVRGRWTEELYPPFIAAALTMPAAGLLAVAGLIGISWRYPWAAAARRPGALQAGSLGAGVFIRPPLGPFPPSAAVVLHRPHRGLFRAVDRRGAGGAQRLWQSRPHDPDRVGRADPLRLDRVVCRHRLGRIADAAFPLVDLRTFVHHLPASRRRGLRHLRGIAAGCGR